MSRPHPDCVVAVTDWPAARVRAQHREDHAPCTPRAPTSGESRSRAGTEPEPPAGFCVIGGRTQLRHPRAAAIGDLHPDSASAGRHRDRDRLPGTPRAALPQAVAEKFAREQDSIIAARVPWAEHRAHERADGPRSLHPPGNLHALPDRRTHLRTAFPPARKPAGPRADAPECTLTSAAIVKPSPHRRQTLPQKGDRCARLPRVLPVKTRAQPGEKRNPPGRKLSRTDIPYH